LHPQEDKLMSRSEIAAVNRMFEEAAGKGDLESLAALYTRDAVALPPDGRWSGAGTTSSRCGRPLLGKSD